MEYLENYLAVLPDYDRNEVEQLIQENLELFEVKAITAEEFEALLNQLAKRTSKVTKLEPTGEKLDAEHFNNMHSNVAIDLKRLYNSHAIVEKVLANYDRILQGALEDVKREVDSLTVRIDELNLKAKSEDGLIVRTYGFEEKDKSKYMETDYEKYSDMFKDRDGSTQLPQASLNRAFAQYYLALPIRTVTDALHDSAGNTTAKITLAYEPANALSDTNHPLVNAIDDSKTSYWAQAVVSESPAYTEIPKI